MNSSRSSLPNDQHWKSPVKSLRSIDVYYPTNLSLILAPLYPRDFSVPVEYNPLLDLYIPKEPLSNYSVEYWEIERPPSGKYLPASEGFFRSYRGAPSDLRSLALTFGADDDPTYESLLALERFFRENFILAGSPEVECDDLRDAVFRTRRLGPYGMASAFTIVARMMGFPARLVAGYRVPPSTDYRVVSFANVTYWPEVKFKGLGWIRFDPFPSTPLVLTETSDDGNLKIEGFWGKVYWNGSLMEPPFEVTLDKKTVVYLPVLEDSFRYLRLVSGDVGIDIASLPPLLSPGENATVRVLLVRGSDFVVSSDVPVYRNGYELSITPPNRPGVYWVELKSGLYSVRFPVVVTDNVTVTVDGYPGEVKAGSNLTVFGRVLWHGKPLNGGVVRAVLGLRKGEEKYVVGSAEVKNGKYAIHASVPGDIAQGDYWLVVKYTNFPYLGQSDSVVRIVPAEGIVIGSGGTVPAGGFNLTGTAPEDVPIDVLLDGQKVASVVPRNGSFSVPLNLSPGSHELKLVPRSGGMTPVKTEITAVEVKLDLKPYSSADGDYLRLLGTVEGMENGKLEIQTPSGKIPVDVNNGRFEVSLPVEFPGEGSDSVNLLPLKFLADGRPIDERKVALSSGKILSDVPTVVKTGNGFFTFAPEGSSGENRKFGIGAFDFYGRPLSGKLGLDLGGRKVDLSLKDGTGHLELPKIDLKGPKVNLPSVGGHIPSAPSPDLEISGFSPSFGGNFPLLLVLPFVLLGAVLLVRAGVSG
nr:transglutaminase-like domain-containing protein [Thermococcus stetteri]